jgi:hypothetical protein
MVMASHLAAIQLNLPVMLSISSAVFVFAGSAWCAGLSSAGEPADTSRSQHQEESQLSEHIITSTHATLAQQPSDVAGVKTLEKSTGIEDQIRQQRQAAEQRASTPYTAVRKDKAWKVARDASGGLAGMPRPAVSSRIQHILHKIFTVGP